LIFEKYQNSSIFSRGSNRFSNQQYYQKIRQFSTDSTNAEKLGEPSLKEMKSKLKDRYHVFPRIPYLLKRLQPWTVDDFFAMFSWVIMGNILFIFVGTTTFVSLIAWVANTLQFQGIF